MSERPEVIFDRAGSMSTKNGFAIFFVDGWEYYASKNDVRWIVKNLSSETNLYTNKSAQAALFGENKTRLVGRVARTYSGKSMKILLGRGKDPITYYVNTEKAGKVLTEEIESCQISKMLSVPR